MSGWYGYVPIICLVLLYTQYLVGMVMYPISGWCGYIPNMSGLLWLYMRLVWVACLVSIILISSKYGHSHVI